MERQELDMLRGHLARHDYDEAERYLRELLGARPERASVLYELGKVLRARGDLAGAAECSRKALTADPSKAEYHQAYGVALQELGRVRDAIELYAEAVRLKPDLVRGWNALGTALLLTGEPNRALGAFRIARAHYLRGVLELLGIAVPPPSGDPSGLARDDPLLANVIVVPPEAAAIVMAEGEYARLMRHLAHCFVDLGDLERARVNLEQALDFAAGDDRLAIEDDVAWVKERLRRPRARAGGHRGHR
ncbi:MAG: tetratricopeptide repeat protein [Gemmatimonadetes bacterium]|nr:tetratricopeptide repeat protein [Gemmatimonadota bacterium]